MAPQRHFPHTINNISSSHVRRTQALGRLARRFNTSRLADAHRSALDDVLFVVMASSQEPARLLLQRETWCRPPVHCAIMQDDTVQFTPMGAGALPQLTRLPVESPSPERCCSSAPDDAARKFFCSSHRLRTLRAQYRFLPALVWAKRQLRSASPSYGEHRSARSYGWVVLVDDDSFVFAFNLVQLLAQYRTTEPLYLGDFYFDRSARSIDREPLSRDDATRHHGSPKYACGGGGSIFSRAALQVSSVCLVCYMSVAVMRLSTSTQNTTTRGLHVPLGHRAATVLMFQHTGIPRSYLPLLLSRKTVSRYCAPLLLSRYTAGDGSAGLHLSICGAIRWYAKRHSRRQDSVRSTPLEHS